MNKIIYLDAAASCLKPQAVIDAELNFLTRDYSNSGRGICARAAATDEMLRQTRRRVADFIGADSAQVVFTSGTTDGMNRIADIVFENVENIRSVAVSDLDHHSARMPWEHKCKKHGAKVLRMELGAGSFIDADSVPAADVVVITAMSNVLGAAQPVADIIASARRKNPNVITVVDAAQYVAHCPIDVRAWDCDFMVFSGHKIGADTGIGVMYIKNPDSFYPDKFGGGMVSRITDDGWRLEAAPSKFEAGTLPLTQIAGMAPAIDAWQKWGGSGDLIGRLYDAFADNAKIKILTTRDAAMFTFVVPGMHVLDVGAMLGAHNICVRAGNMCATWIHRALGVPGSVRVSVGPWNTVADIDALINVLQGILK